MEAKVGLEGREKGGRERERMGVEVNKLVAVPCRETEVKGEK